MRPARPGRAALRLGACGLLGLLAASACGKKGPPLPPLRPVPSRITDLTAYRAGDRITLRFTVPATNVGGTTPAAVERVEVYRAEAPPEPPAAAEPATPPAAPPAGQPPAAVPPLVSPDHLIATIPVDRGATEGPPAGRALVAPGLEATYVDQAPAAAAAGAGAAPTWRYVVVPVAGGDRRPAASNLVEMPLGAVVPPVEDLEATYDASAWRLAWTAPGPEVTFVVLEVPAEGGGEPAPLTEAAIEATEFRAPLEFGRRRCFVVRPVLVRGAATIEGPASAPACDTPVDTFAPPAPAGLVAVQVGGAVDLRWAASAAADLAGYVVLRGEGAGETLQPLVTAPVAGTSYRDEAVRAGVTYIYEVVAVDRATPPNTSPPSNRQTVVVRQASGGS